jgi:hypothetical protein
MSSTVANYVGSVKAFHLSSTFESDQLYHSQRDRRSWYCRGWHRDISVSLGFWRFTQLALRVCHLLICWCLLDLSRLRRPNLEQFEGKNTSQSPIPAVLTREFSRQITMPIIGSWSTTSFLPRMVQMQLGWVIFAYRWARQTFPRIVSFLKFGDFRAYLAYLSSFQSTVLMIQTET